MPLHAAGVAPMMPAMPQPPLVHPRYHGELFRFFFERDGALDTVIQLNTLLFRFLCCAEHRVLGTALMWVFVTNAGDDKTIYVTDICFTGWNALQKYPRLFPGKAELVLLRHSLPC